MCAGVPGSIPGADKLDLTYHASEVGEMRSNYQYMGDQYRRLPG